MKLWHRVKNNEENQKFVKNFWSRHRLELKSGEFWADRIKQFRDEPIKRLRLALENLPLPASFKEAAIALRALIREKKKSNLDYEELLDFLYWLAAISSFSVPYSDVLQEPGYNVVESIPGEKLKNLSFSYSQLGYEKLELLNKTDTKWVVELWGEPSSHTTLHEIHIDIWRHYENILKKKRKKQFESLF